MLNLFEVYYEDIIGTTSKVISNNLLLTVYRKENEIYNYLDEVVKGKIHDGIKQFESSFKH